MPYRIFFLLLVHPHHAKDNDKGKDKDENGNPVGDVEEVLKVAEGASKLVVKSFDESRIAVRDRSNKRVRTLRKKGCERFRTMPVGACGNEGDANNDETD